MNFLKLFTPQQMNNDDRNSDILEWKIMINFWYR